MKDEDKIKKKLVNELIELRRRVGEFEALEIERKRTEDSLRESERRLSTLIGNLPGVVYRCLNDENWTMEFISDGCFELTGFKPLDLVRNQTVSFNDLIHPDDRRFVWDDIQEALGKKTPFRLEYRIRAATGQEKSVWDQGVGVFSDGGDLLALEGFIIDVTEKKSLEAELEKAKNLALLGEFSSAAAHQIRNPLGDILLGTKLLQKVLKLNGYTQKNDKQAAREFPSITPGSEKLASIFWNLSEGVSNLNRVVTELLEYTKTLRLNLSSQKIDLILRETMDVFQDMINQNAITVEEHYGTELSPLSVDAVLISQVFQNIIHNAIEAMPDGGRLSLTSGFFRQEPEYAIISISDTGVSLKASEIEKIFRPFYTTKNSGIGLGLSLAHRIIEAHKGKIWVCQNPCSHLGTGSREIITSRAATSQSKGVTVHILLPTAGKQHELTDT